MIPTHLTYPSSFMGDVTMASIRKCKLDDGNSKTQTANRVRQYTLNLPDKDRMK